MSERKNKQPELIVRALPFRPRDDENRQRAAERESYNKWWEKEERKKTERMIAEAERKEQELSQ